MQIRGKTKAMQISLMFEYLTFARLFLRVIYEPYPLKMPKMSSINNVCLMNRFINHSLQYCEILDDMTFMT
jgi:hypothetical protein